MAPKRIAIVGSGCSGIAALWALKDAGHDIHLFESADRLGGHTNTVAFEHEGKKVMVDTGFIVMNTATYPNFIAFLKEIGIKPVDTNMTFGVSRDNGLFEWAGTNLWSIFAQRENVFSARMWRMIFDIVRFNQFALDLLMTEEESEEDPVAGSSESSSGPKHQESIGDYLDREGYSDAFRDDYLIPMTACVWSTSPEKCSLEFPAITLVRFLWNHHLLSTIAARPSWMTITGGSKRYIDVVMKAFPQKNVHLSTPIAEVTTGENGKVTVRTTRGETEEFDHVILATHGDQALKIVESDATSEEKKILSGFKTSRNVAVMHSDLSLMPKRRIAWSCWNFMTKSSASASNTPNQVCLTYNMNILQHIPASEYGDILVTLNPLTPPSPALSQGIWEYEHPLYNAEAVRSQKLLPKIQNTRGISYCGAWTKYGFHEDGFSSGLKAAQQLGAKLPFDFVDSTFSRGKKPVLEMSDLVLRVGIRFVMLAMAVWGMTTGSLTNGKSAATAKTKKLS